jgi:hypothetical protein
MSSFFRLLYNCVSVDYDKLLSQERYKFTFTTELDPFDANSLQD